MRYFIILSLIVFLPLITFSFDEKPHYSLKDSRIFGKYKLIPESDHYEAVINAEIKQDKNKKTIIIFDTIDGQYETELTIIEKRIAFDLDGLAQDCDYPDCNYITEISGSISREKINNKWMPVVTVNYITNHPYPECEESYEQSHSAKLKYSGLN